MIPLDTPSTSTIDKEEHIKLQLVSPSAQLVEMAKEGEKRKRSHSTKRTNQGKHNKGQNKRQKPDVFSTK